MEINKNILISAAGKRVSLVKAFIKEARAIDPAIKVLATDAAPELAPACVIADKAIRVKKIGAQGYTDELLAICKANKVGLVIPTIDTELELLAAAKDLFLQNNITIVVSSPDFVKICRDKRLTAAFFKERAINVPYLMQKETLRFPLFIKPYDGSLSKDAEFIESAAQLRPHHLSNPKLLFMEYMDPAENDEYTIDAYYDKAHELKCLIPRKRIEVRAGEISKGVTIKNAIIPALETALAYIPGAIGCLTIQVFFNRKNENITGIEINPRFGGGFPLSYLAGGNYPGYILREYFLNQEVAPKKDWEAGLLMLRYDDEILVHGYKD